MQKLGRDYSLFEYLYFFIIVIFSSMSTQLTSTLNGYSYKSGVSIFWFLAPLFLTFCFIIKTRTKFVSFILKVVIVFFVWFFVQFFKTSNLYIPSFFFIIYPIIIAYIVAYHYKDDMFLMYERIVVTLSLITFVLWLSVLIMPSVMEGLINKLSVVPVRDTTVTYKSSIIIFNLTDSNNYSFNPNIRRNAGFSWEAGRYAVMVIFAMYLNLRRNNFKISIKNKSFIILFLALFSSQSTTGYSAFLLLIFFVLNKKRQSATKYILYFIFISFFIFLMGLDFYGGKIEYLSNMDKSRIDEYVYVVENNLSERSELGVSLQRFDAAAMQFINFLHDPICGYGLDTRNAYINKTIYNGIRYPNGDATIFAEWGIFIALFFYILLFKASIRINLEKKNIFKYSFALIFIALNFSYNLWLVPIFLAFIFYPILQNSTYKVV